MYEIFSFDVLFIRHHKWYLTLHNEPVMGMKQQLTKCSAHN